jgi:hypothetical protein
MTPRVSAWRKSRHYSPRTSKGWQELIGARASLADSITGYYYFAFLIAIAWLAISSQDIAIAILLS